jgi:hypothetical protein
MNKKKIIIVRIAEGLGNQLFMFANSYFLAKVKKCTLMIDDESGYFKNKNQLRKRKFLLNFFNINNKICSDKLKFKNYLSDLFRKLLKILDYFKYKKKFLIEYKNKYKNTYFKSLTNYPLDNVSYIEGHVESEKYFCNIKKDLQEILTVKKDYIDYNNKYINLITKKNSVSLHIRRHKFSEENKEMKIKKNIEKSNIFTKELISYNYSGIEYFRKKINKPTFFIWSNDFKGLEKYFNYSDCVFVKNNNVIMDFYLFSICKHFIVGGSTFHWMGAWLNTNKKKLCVRPKNINLNPSNNVNFWPESWVKI